MAAVPTPERKRLPDRGANGPLRGRSNRMVMTPTSSAALPVTSEGSARTLVFDHRESLVAPRRRSRLGWSSFIIIVLTPVLAAAYYYFVVAADQYVSKFRFALRSAEPERH